MTSYINGPPPGTALALSSFRDDTPIVIDAADAPLSLTVDDVLNYIAPGAPRADALMFLMTCRAARLNPLLKDAFLVPLGDKWATVIARSGYLKRAQANPDYAGHEFGIIAQAFDPKTQVRGAIQDFPGTFLPPGFIVLGGWAKVFRKSLDRPFCSRISLVEYGKSAGLWKTLTCTMIAKTALVHSLRDAFGIGDSYDESEVVIPRTLDATAATSTVSAAVPWAPVVDADERGPTIVEARVSPAPVAPIPPPAPAPTDLASPPPTPITRELAGRLHELMKRAGMTPYQVNVALTKRGVDRVEDLDMVAATTMVNKLEATVSAMTWDPLTGGAQKSESKDAARPEGEADAKPRERQPGDDDEPFDDATGRVLTLDEAIDADGADGSPGADGPPAPGDRDRDVKAEIDAEFDRPIDMPAKPARKGKAASAAPVAH